MEDKIKIMRKFMNEVANYNWGFCYARSDKKTEETFKKNFPEAYQKIITGQVIHMENGN